MKKLLIGLSFLILSFNVFAESFAEAYIQMEIPKNEITQEKTIDEIPKDEITQVKTIDEIPMDERTQEKTTLEIPRPPVEGKNDLDSLIFELKSYNP